MDLVLKAFDFVVEFAFLLLIGGLTKAFAGGLEFLDLGFPHVGLGGD